MGPAGKAYTLPGSKPPEPKKEEPCQNLGFTAVGMAESKDTAAFTRQDPPEGVEQGNFVL
jgi:hypothetical protein